MAKEENNNQLPLNIRIGIDHQLFFFDPFSPGSAFWLPNGTRLYNKLREFIRNEYFKRDFEEVKTPIIAKNDLWKISGHLDKYKENMFAVTYDDIDYSIKPMQCPLHCLMFKHSTKSYRDLPLRLADFGELHRKEASGALTSLFRNIKFSQDDSHIFCMRDQVKSEVKNAIEFLSFVYNKFGFKFEVGLSTRPEKFIGTIELWNDAEKELADVLNESGLPWKEFPEDGAFYGPKIDIHLTDSLGRKHQCGTIQLDFQLPIKFDLKYVSDTGSLETPVIIHRAIYGSFERFIAIVLEHTNGKLPFWLNWNQIVIVPVSDKYINYCNKIKSELKAHKYYVDVDLTDNNLAKKIRNAEIAHYNYIVVIGEKEIENNTLNVRDRSGNKLIFKINDFTAHLQNDINNFK